MSATEAPSDAEADQFFAAAGRCIAGWSFIDQVLYDLFVIVLGADPTKASIVYYRSHSFSDHLVLTDKIIAVTLAKGTPERKEWDALKRRIDKLLPTRNKIAHHPITVFDHEAFNRDPSGKMWATDRKIWLSYIDEMRRYPDLDKRARAKRALESQIKTDDLIKHHSESVDLHKDLLDFYGRSADMLQKRAQAQT